MWEERSVGVARRVKEVASIFNDGSWVRVNGSEKEWCAGARAVKFMASCEVRVSQDTYFVGVEGILVAVPPASTQSFPFSPLVSLPSLDFECVVSCLRQSVVLQVSYGLAVMRGDAGMSIGSESPGAGVVRIRRAVVVASRVLSGFGDGWPYLFD